MQISGCNLLIKNATKGTYNIRLATSIKFSHFISDIQHGRSDNICKARHAINVHHVNVNENPHNTAY